MEVDASLTRVFAGAGCWLLVAGCWLLVAGCWLVLVRTTFFISLHRLISLRSAVCRRRIVHRVVNAKVLLPQTPNDLCYSDLLFAFKLDDRRRGVDSIARPVCAYRRQRRQQQ